MDNVIANFFIPSKGTSIDFKFNFLISFLLDPPTDMYVALATVTHLSQDQQDSTRY